MDQATTSKSDLYEAWSFGSYLFLPGLLSTFGFSLNIRRELAELNRTTEQPGIPSEVQ